MSDAAGPRSRYAITLDALEASAHVRVEDQIESQDEDPPQVREATDSQQRAELLRIAG